MRKSINGLSALVQYEMKKNPFARGYYVFCSRSRKLLKVLYWDRTGFALWYNSLRSYVSGVSPASRGWHVFNERRAAEG